MHSQKIANLQRKLESLISETAASCPDPDPSQQRLINAFDFLIKAHDEFIALAHENNFDTKQIALKQNNL